LTKEDWPVDLRETGGVIEGRSLIVSPQGSLVAGPMEKTGLLVAEIDMDEIARGKFDLDVAGHYNRPDVFGFYVRRRQEE
jgi:predicted amidohydrolase